MAGLQHRCWNHEGREAVCRCPECGRGFCHECVSEHESRLLCAACIAKLAPAVQARRGGLRRMLPAAMVLAGLFLAGTFFYATGQIVNFFIDRAEESQWQSR